MSISTPALLYYVADLILPKDIVCNPKSYCIVLYMEKGTLVIRQTEYSANNNFIGWITGHQKLMT